MFCSLISRWINPKIVRKIESSKRLLHDADDLAVIELASAGFRQSSRVHSADVFSNQINNAVVRAVLDVADDILMLQSERRPRSRA